MKSSGEISLPAFLKSIGFRAEFKMTPREYRTTIRAAGPATEVAAEAAADAAAEDSLAEAG